MTQSITFNNGKIRDGLELVVSRNAATYNGNDELVAANAPRYGKARAYHSRSAPTAADAHSGTGTATTLAGGVDLAGTGGMALIRKTGPSSLWVRSGSGLNTQYQSRSGTHDPLTVTGRTHYITGAEIRYGLIVTQCSVQRTSPGTVETTCLIYSQDGGPTWALWPVESGSAWSEDTNYPAPNPVGTIDGSTTMGNIWSLNWFQADDLDEPLDIWVTFTDYRNNDKDGGCAYIARATRSSVGAAWVLQDIRKVYESQSAATTEHAHSCAMAQDPATGNWHAVVFFGDTSYNHVVNVLIDGDDYLTATLTANETWSGGTPGSITVPRSAQPTSCFPMPNGDIAATADNERSTILCIKASSLSEDKAEWYTVGPQAGTLYSGTLSLFGNYERDGFGRCYTARHNPKEGTTTAGETNTIASIDGTNWFQIGDSAFIYIAGPYIIGDVSNQLYTLPRPTTSNVRTARPLEVAPGGDNIQTTSLSATGAGNGEDIAEVTADGNGDYLWPSGFARAGEAMPAPPRPGQVFAFDCTDSTNFVAWNRAVTVLTQTNNTDYTFVVWGLVPQDSTDLAFKLWQGGGEQENHTRVTGNRWIRLNVSRKWVTGNTGNVQILIDTTSSTPQSRPQFALLLEGTYPGFAQPYWIPTNTTGRPNERATIKGLTVASDWSVGVDVNYPDDSDAAGGQHGAANPGGPIVTLWQDAMNYITVETADNAADGYPYDFVVTVTQNGSDGTPAVFAGESLDYPGAPIRPIVSKVDADTVVSLQHGGNFPALTSTITGESIAPRKILLASNATGSAVNRLEFAKVVAADTQANTITELDAATGADNMAIPSDLTRKHAITIDATKVGTGGVTNFSVCLQRDHFADEVVDPSGDYAARTDGGDIRFSSDAAGATQLACDVISFAHDTTTGAGDAAIEVRVLVPSLSATVNTVIYVWYKGSTTTAQPASTDTYGSDYAYDDGTAYHFPMGPEDSTAVYADRTANGNDGAITGLSFPTDDIAGQVGRATQWANSSDRVDVDAPLRAGGTFTWSAWLRNDASADSLYVYDEGHVSDTAKPFFSIRTGTGTGGDRKKLLIITRNAASGNFSSSLSTGVFDTADDWHHIAVVGNAAGNPSYIMYFDGAADAINMHDATGGDFSSLTLATIGEARHGASIFNPWKGDIDDVFGATVARSAAWIKTEYNQTAAPSTFATAGPGQAAGSMLSWNAWRGW